MGKRLTAAMIDRLRPAPVGRRENYFDNIVPGLHVRVTDRGVRTFAVMTRVGARQVHVTLGRWGVMTLEKARERGRAVLQEAAGGRDPRTRRRSRKIAGAPSTRVEDVVTEFLDKHVRAKRRASYVASTESLLNKHVLPRWSGRDIRDLTRRDVRDVVDAIMESGRPIAANRALASLRKLFAWCLDRDILPSSPAAGVKPPAEESERDRALSDAEIALLWRVWDAMAYPAGRFQQLLLVTAQRRSEVATMKWTHLDLDTEKPVWRLARESTKADRSHDVPLPPMAVRLIRSLPELGDFVFSSGLRGDRPVSGFAKIKARTDAMALALMRREAQDRGHDPEKVKPLPDWRLHDLRRTAGSYMARLSVPVFVISRVLNHAEGGVTRIYARHSYFDEKSHALATWASKLQAIVDPAPPANVVPLRAAPGMS